MEWQWQSGSDDCKCIFLATVYRTLYHFLLYWAVFDDGYRSCRISDPRRASEICLDSDCRATF
jgi:hypothetical protein